MMKAAPLLAALLLSACSLAGPPSRYLIEAAPTDLRLPARVSTIELREVSLPLYAGGDEVVQGQPDGALRANKNTLWADEPSRAVTATLARSLGEITGAVVAADPWPLAGLPDARIEVRVDKMLAGADGVFRLEGQYFVAPLGRDFSESAERFALSAPVAGDGATALSAASGQALTDLAELIARRIAR
jgi:uncharacterized lipoprotein YmbA